jgi:hypothetical protein
LEGWRSLEDVQLEPVEKKEEEEEEEEPSLSGEEAK